jgi:hypothetical protein
VHDRQQRVTQLHADILGDRLSASQGGVFPLIQGPPVAAQSECPAARENEVDGEVAGVVRVPSHSNCADVRQSEQRAAAIEQHTLTSIQDEGPGILPGHGGQHRPEDERYSDDEGEFPPGHVVGPVDDESNADAVDERPAPEQNEESVADEPAPGRLTAKLRRALAAPVPTLVEEGIIPSAEVLARVIPQITAQVRAAGISDPALRRLYGAVYTAFRRRRSLLLLNLESQVKLGELPWVRAIDPYRQPASASGSRPGRSWRR